ncbi:MAG: TonB-dependent receptor, partial [Saprospiraceae bacterium]
MRMQSYIFWGILLLTTPVFAQNTFRGTVTDKVSGEVLPQVSIYLSDLKQGVVADLNGQYTFKNLPAGTFLVELRYASYQTKTQRVQVQGDTRMDFQLEVAVTELNEVVVTGATHATELREHPVAVAVIDNLALTKVNSTNLIDAIAKKPGLSQITTGAGISKPVIRGLGYNRIITLYNGLRQEGQQWGDEHG